MAATHPSTFFQQAPTNKATTPFASTRNTPPDTTKLHLVKPVPAATTTAARSWSFLIPTILVASLGAVFIPHFALGLAAGVVQLFASVIALRVLTHILNDKTKMKPSYTEIVTNNKLMVTSMAPLLEELMFRGTMQPLIILALTLLIPSLACIPVLSTGLNVAMLSSLLITAVSFGWSNKGNAETGNAQVYSATLSGLAYGLLALQFGLGAAIAAHMMHNTLAICALTAVASLDETKTPQEEAEAVASFAP